MTTTTNTINTDTDFQNFWWVVVFWTDPKFSQNMYKAMVWAITDETWEMEPIWEWLCISESIRKREMLLECASASQMNSIIADMQTRFSFADNKYNSNPIDDTRQIPEIAWSFECEWKWYIILFPRNALTDETIPERGIYKWVIINPELYFSDDAQKQVDEGSQRTGEILDGK